MHFLSSVLFIYALVMNVNTQESLFSMQHFCHFDTLTNKNDSCPLNLDILEEYSKSDNEWKIDFEVFIIIKLCNEAS